MTLVSPRIGHHAPSTRPVTPALPHVRYLNGRTEVDLGSAKVRIIDRDDGINQLFERYQLERPNGDLFAAELMMNGKPVMTRPVYHHRWEGALLRMLAVATERGLVQFALEQPSLPRRIRVIDCTDRKLLVAAMPKYGNHVVLGAVLEAYPAKQLWHPVGEACESIASCYVKSPGEAMLMALQALYENRSWT